MIVFRPTYGMVALKQAIEAFVEQMQAENIDLEVQRRIVNRLLYDNPDGPEQRENPDQKQILEPLPKAFFDDRDLAGINMYDDPADN